MTTLGRAEPILGDERHRPDTLGDTGDGAATLACPDDLLNFQYDPVAVAAALGWRGSRYASWLSPLC